MTRAKRLLETFTWNPNWGTNKGLLRRVKNYYNYLRVYHFKWKDLDLMLVWNGSKNNLWHISDFYTGFVVVNDFKTSTDSEEEAYKIGLDSLDKIGIDSIREKIKHGNKENTTITYM